jgi:hypothetical protein
VNFASNSHCFTVTPMEEVVRRPIVMASLLVPKRVAVRLDLGRDYLIVPSASVGGEQDVQRRVSQWQKGHQAGAWLSLSVRAASEFLSDMIAEGCDTRVKVKLSASDWDGILKLAKRLSISPADWILASAGYNAWLAEQRSQVGGGA